MMPYLVVISSSVLLLNLSGNWSRAKNSKTIEVVLIIVALLLPCVLAGARDEGVGLDTRGYGQLIFNAARDNSGIMECWSAVEAGGYDIAPLYFLQAYIVVRLTDSQFMYYFLIQALTIIPFYLAIRRVAEPQRTWLGMMAYYLIIYMLSLSAMRQCVAMAFVTLSLVLLVDGDRLKSLPILAVAILMHWSAVVCVIFFVGWICFVKRDNGEPALRRHAEAALLVVAAVFALLWINADAVLHFVVSIPMFEEYSKYLLGATTTNYKSFFLFFGGMLLSLCPLLYYKRGGERVRLGYWAILSLLAIPVYSLQAYNEQFIRLSYYFWPFYIVAFSCKSSISDDMLKRLLISCQVAFLLFAATQFVWNYWANNYFEFLPYRSVLLGI